MATHESSMSVPPAPYRILIAVADDDTADWALLEGLRLCAARGDCDCLAVRAETRNATYWCERHSEGHPKPHVYEPRPDGRSSVMPTY
jgi:hypothetical protein